MRFFLFSNDEDTLVGMRIAGIEGSYVTEKEELLAALEETLDKEYIGIVLISSSLARLAEKELIAFKKSVGTLIVEIPDKNGSSGSTGIMKYVNEAMGLKM